jgi:hypothetical protein
MHSSVFGMHVHLGLFAQLSQSGRSESKNAKVTKKNPGMGIPLERPSFSLVRWARAECGDRKQG